MEPMQDRTETNIGEYIAVLRRRWMVIAGTMILVVAIVAALDFSKTPIYEASSQLLLQPKQSESIFSPAQSSVDPTRAVQNELKIINSLAVRTAVAKAYGEKISISAVSGGDDDVIILSATDSNPKDAARKVNVYAETYQTERFNAIVDDHQGERGGPTAAHDLQRRPHPADEERHRQRLVTNLDHPYARLDERLQQPRERGRVAAPVHEHAEPRGGQPITQQGCHARRPRPARFTRFARRHDFPPL